MIFNFRNMIFVKHEAWIFIDKVEISSLGYGCA